MFMRNQILAWLFIYATAPLIVWADSPNLGRQLNDVQLAAWQRTIYPNGDGLPPGSGDVAQGDVLFKAQCANCHGSRGQGHTAVELAGGQMALDSEWPDKTIGAYWPYATTLFDFIKRAMPMHAPGALNDNQVYALCAYLLHLNGIVESTAVLDAAQLTAIKMPNRDGFIWIDAP